MATNRAPEQIATVTITNKQLKKFVGSGFTTNYTIDLSQMTVVFTHGWNRDPNVWAKNTAANMKTAGVTNANLLAWDWHEVAGTPEPSLANSQCVFQCKSKAVSLLANMGQS